MRPLLLAAVLVVAAAAAWWLTAGPPRPPATAGPSAARRTERRPGPALGGPSALPERNVFEYAGRPPAVRGRMAPMAPTAPPSTPEAVPPPPLPDPVRLVGLVQRGGRLRAVLSVQGEVAILGPGEQIQGYRVLAVDEERVRVQAPDGTERALARPEGD